MLKRYHDGAYSDNEGRMKQEAQDSGMIREDRSAVANLPQDVKYHSWSAQAPYLNPNLDDTSKGIDKQKSEDGAGMKRHLAANKY